jgi:hypothetical protein
MSLIAIGGTAAIAGTAAVTTGTVAAGAALASTAIGAYGAYSSRKAAKAAGALGGGSFDPRQIAAILASVEEYAPVDVAGVTSRTAKKNASEGVALARSSATKLNKTATKNTIDSMNAMFGGEESYNELREKALADIADNMDGRVSASTRAQIGRRLLGSGVTDLGDGATADSMTGYLGLTSEGLSAQGQEQFKSLYQTWRQAVPLINGAQILDRFTISPDNAVQAEIMNNQNIHQSSLGIANLEMQGVGMGYQVGMNNRSMAMEAGAMRANADQQMLATIATGVGAVAGTYSATRPAAPAKTPVITPAYSGHSTAGGRNVSDRYIG